MAVTNEQISEYLSANPSLSDAEIAAAMAEHRVTPEQMAQATGLGQDVVQSRYNAAVAPLSMQSVANTPGMGSAGIGVNFTGQSLAPDYAASMATPLQSVSSGDAAYLQSKLDQLASDPVAMQQAKDLGWTGGSADDLKSFMGSFGLTPEQHYKQYGVNEGLSFPGLGGVGASAEAEIDPYVYAYDYGVANNDFSGLRSLLNKTPDSTSLISKYGLTPEQIDQIEFGTGFDLDQSGGYGAGKVGNEWNYGKYLDELREGDKESLDAAVGMLRSADPLGAQRLENMYQELLKQQTVTGDNWATGNLGSKDAAAMDFALRLMENDLDSIYDLGQRTVDVERFDSEAGNYTTQETEFFNKKTGEALPDWARVASGASSGSKLNYQINFADDGTPIPYTTPKQSDWMGFREGFVKPAISIVALANPALAPYIAAGNALNAANKGDWGSAIVSGLTAASGFSGDLGLTASTAATLSDAKTAAQVLNAIDKGNPIALATALMQTDTGKELMGQDMGGGIKMGDVVNTAKVAQLVNTGNYAEALATVGQMTNSPNLKLSASAVNLAQAFQTGDPFKIISAVGQLDRAVKSADTAAKKEVTGDLGNRVYDDTITQAGADAFLRAKEAGASDEDAMAASNAVTGVQVNKIPDAESGNAVTTTYDQRAATVDSNFGDLQGAIEANAMDDAVRADKLSTISETPRFADAYSQARELLGPNQTFTWNGKQYSTATAQERPDLSAPAVQAATDESAAETVRLTRQNADLVTGNAPDQSAAETTRLANLNAGLKSMEKTGFLGQIYKDLNEQFRLQGVAANEYLANNPNSPITESVSSAFEAAGELSRNLGGVALALDNKPLADVIIKGGERLQEAGQSIGSAPQDTQNWKDTIDLIDKASGVEKLAVMAGRIMDGTSGLGRQVELELRQELPALFLGGGLLRPTMIASGLIDTADTGGAAVVDAYDEVIKKGGTHQEGLLAGRKAGAAAAATEAAIQLTLGKLADVSAGKLDNLISKGTTKIAGEGVVEGAQEAGASVAVDLALGNAIDINKALTQGVLGAAVGKGTATATSGVDAAQTDALNQTAATSGSAGAAATDLGAVGATQPGAELVAGADVNAIDNVIPGGDAVVGGASTLGGSSAATISVADAEQTMSDLGLNVSGDAAVSLATKIQDATNSGNNVSVTSDANIVTINDATANTQTTVDANTGTTTVVDANANTTSQTTVDANSNTQTTVTVDANTNTNTQTTVNNNTNVTTSVTVDANSTTQTTIDANNNTQTTVLTNTDTNTQTTVKVNTDTGDVIEVKETEIPADWKPPVIEAPVVPGVTEEAKKPAVPKLPSLKGSAEQRGGGGFGLPSGINVDPASLRSKVTGGAIDPLARVKQAQAELEREVMMNQLDPRFAAVIQQRTDPQQQAQQYDKDIGALAKLLSGEPSGPSNEGKYYSYGSEDSIDDILGGMAANYKEGGFVEPLKASGGMVLPLLAKSGGALGKYSGREDFKDGKHVAGDGDGQSDDIPAWLADGELVFPADVVSALGNGSTKAGTDKLYAMMHGIRDRARSKGPKDLPPPALKSPLDYLKSSKRSK